MNCLEGIWGIGGERGAGMGWDGETGDVGIR